MLEEKVISYKANSDFNIESFCSSANLAHNVEYYNPQYVTQKFTGWYDITLAVIVRGETFIGTIAFGKSHADESILFSLETFVIPEYRGKGLFTRLLRMIDEVLLVANASSIINFPNSNSLSGFIKNGFDNKGKVRACVIPLIPFGLSRLKTFQPVFQDTLVKGLRFSKKNLESRFLGREDFRMIKIRGMDVCLKINKRRVTVMDGHKLGLLDLLYLTLKLSLRGYSFMLVYSNQKLSFLTIPTNANLCTYRHSAEILTTPYSFHML